MTAVGTLVKHMATKDDLAELTRKLRTNENPVWNSTPAIAHSFRELARNVEAWDQPHSVSRLAVYANQLLVGILDALSKQQHSENEQLTTHRRTIELFLRDLEQGRVDVSHPWSLDQMAKQCGMGVTAFSKYCREIVNSGPVEFLNHCRLNVAARKLREGNGLFESSIVEDTENDGVLVVITQGHRLGYTAHVITFRLVVTQNVGAKCALLIVRACGLVVGHSVGRY